MSGDQTVAVAVVPLVQVMLRVKGHFDGVNVMLDEPPPPQLVAGTPVVVVVADGPSDTRASPGPFFDELERLSGGVQGPPDLAEPHDHYAPGAPKRVLPDG